MRAIELEPDNSQYHHNLATVYYQQENYSLALDEFKKSVQMDPDDEESKKFIEELTEK